MFFDMFSKFLNIVNLFGKLVEYFGRDTVKYRKQSLFVSKEMSVNMSNSIFTMGDLN